MQRKRLLYTAITAAFLLILASCGAGSISKSDAGTLAANSSESDTSTAIPTANTPVETQPSDDPAASGNTEVTLYPAALDMPAGRSVTLTAAAGGNQAAEWTSSNPGAASVSQDGTVKALSSGEALITVTAGGSSASCRVTVTGESTTLAYAEDPGPVNQDGQREQSDNQEDNFPVIVPDDQKTVDKAFFEDAEYAWQFIVDDGFDTKLQVPNTSIAYMVNYGVVLDARRSGGDSPLGDYSGTIKMEMAIDEESFLSAMKAAGIPATDMSSALQVQTADVSFSVVTYDADKINTAKFAFLPAGKNPVLPLTQICAMAITSVGTSTSGNLSIQIEEGFGGAALSGEAGNAPLVLEVKPDGSAALYLPRMLMMCGRNRFDGVLARMRILDLP